MFGNHPLPNIVHHILFHPPPPSHNPTTTATTTVVRHRHRRHRHRRSSPPAPPRHRRPNRHHHHRCSLASALKWAKQGQARRRPPRSSPLAMPRHRRRRSPHAASPPATSAHPPSPSLMTHTRHVTVDDDPLRATSSTKTTPTNSGRLPLPSLRDVGIKIDGWERGGVRGTRGCKGMGNEEAGGNGRGRGRPCMPPPSLLFIPQANEAA